MLELSLRMSFFMYRVVLIKSLFMCVIDCLSCLPGGFGIDIIPG